MEQEKKEGGYLLERLTSEKSVPGTSPRPRPGCNTHARRKKKRLQRRCKGHLLNNAEEGQGDSGEGKT